MLLELELKSLNVREIMKPISKQQIKSLVKQIFNWNRVNYNMSAKGIQNLIINVWIAFSTTFLASLFSSLSKTIENFASKITEMNLQNAGQTVPIHREKETPEQRRQTIGSIRAKATKARSPQT